MVSGYTYTSCTNGYFTAVPHCCPVSA
jgi:hypothetical protein